MTKQITQEDLGKILKDNGDKLHEYYGHRLSLFERDLADTSLAYQKLMIMYQSLLKEHTELKQSLEKAEAPVENKMESK